MSHALIIDESAVLSRAIRSRLEDYGFDSFDHTWLEQQAIDAAECHVPDLIVVGDAIAEGFPFELAEKLACSNDAPMLVVMTDCFMLQRRLPEGVITDGPRHLSELDAVLAWIAPAGISPENLRSGPGTESSPAPAPHREEVLETAVPRLAWSKPS